MSDKAASNGIRIRQTETDIRTGTLYVENPKGSGKWETNAKAETKKSPIGRQETVSESHSRNKNGSWDGGGPFFTSRTYMKYANTHLSLGPKTRSGVPAKYTGPVGIPLPSTELAKLSAFMKVLGSKDTSHLDPKGATAVALSAPTRSAASLATTLAESVKEGIPSLPGVQTWKGRTKIAKAAGSEYLNAVFGWLPLVDEVKEVSSNISHSAQIAKQYARDENKDVRRRFDFDTVVERSGPDVIGTTAASVGGLTWSFNDFERPETGGDITRETIVTRKCWFSGAFTYALPSDSDTFGRLLRHGELADHVVGTKLTPSLLWELTPWSWAVDWFSNTGRVIDNVTAFGQYGLVMRYGYVMETITEEINYTLSNSALYGAEKRAVGPLSYIRETKIRQPANPFGFGLTWPDLSPTKLLIAAALGITRVR